ncbi:ACN9-domain-containing protein [Limtongia smithiae]|uniref:ACN9-domain-containing protein n=1 Tax=Limtongia smithiae TaxID=1125753 RepID=UPI0034CF1C0D
MRAAISLTARARSRTAMPEVNVLPPLPLYRRILRAHRRLPPEHRFLGDQYVKAEFRLHRSIDNPLQIIGFLSSWQQYVEQIEGDNWKDAKLDMQKLEKMSDQQIIQFYELMQSAKGLDSEYSSHFIDADKLAKKEAVADNNDEKKSK